MMNSIQNSLIEITRELNKEFLMFFYTIYTTNTWSVIMVSNPTLMSIHQL